MKLGRTLNKIAVLSGNALAIGIGNRMLGGYTYQAGNHFAGRNPYQVDNALLQFGMPMGYQMNDLVGLVGLARTQTQRHEARGCANYGKSC